MIETQLTRRSEDLFATLSPTTAQDRAEQLRQVFTAREARLFGIEQPYESDEARQFVANSLLSGLTAVVATTFLFVAVGYLATLGLPDPGYALASVPATLA
jgi:hypothetical protein